MQRGRFCVTGMIRDVFTQRTWRGFTALLVVIAVHAVGLAALTSAGVIAPNVKPFAPLGVVLGGFVFGLGIVLAGGCASGTWYRSAEGLVGSWIALLMYGLSAAAMKYGALSWLQDGLTSYRWNVTTIPALLGVSAWYLVLPFSAGVAVLAAYFLRREAAQPAPARLAPQRTGVAHLLLEKPWHVYATAAVIGVLGVIAWPLSAAAGRNSGLGITTPSADIATWITTGASQRVNWGTMLVLGLLLGAFVAAKASGEFRVRVPSASQSVRSVTGGVMMGVGASLAGGCTVGNGMVETSLFSFQGWVALAAIAAGVGVAARLWLAPGDVMLTSGALVAPAGASDAAVGASALAGTAALRANGAGAASLRTAAAGTTAPGRASSVVAGETLVGPGSQARTVEAAAPSPKVTDAPAWAGLATASPVLTVTRPSASSSASAGEGAVALGGGSLGAAAQGAASPGAPREVGRGRYVLDTLGAVCPFPLLEAKHAMAQLSPGDQLVIDFDCTQATDAIPRWAAQDGHEVTEFRATGDAGWTITLAKSQG